MRETTAAVLRSEIDRLVALVAALSIEKSDSDARMASYRDEVERRGAHIEAIDQERQELQALSNDAHKALDETRRKLAAAQAELEEATAAIDK